ncbi:hypothetical protein evm_007812 [Chilo suppressalis]|nr:hypothetical protein evm_007812 [Chilo suppressalis]
MLHKKKPSGGETEFAGFASKLYILCTVEPSTIKVGIEKFTRPWFGSAEFSQPLRLQRFPVRGHYSTSDPSGHTIPSQLKRCSASSAIRAQLPDIVNQNIENNINQGYERYSYENELPEIPSDADFIPRRNDRIEMPQLKYRFPKTLADNAEQQRINDTKREVVLFINANDKISSTTVKPKKPKRPQPAINKNRNPIRNSEQEEDINTQTPDGYIPMSNTLTGESQIGNRESQTVVKPTVIVNFRGSLSHRDSDIRLESRSDNYTLDSAHNIFNINQEVNFDKKNNKKPNDSKEKQELKIIETNKAKSKNEEDMLCATETLLPQNNVRGDRKNDSVLQILFSV